MIFINLLKLLIDGISQIFQGVDELITLVKYLIGIIFIICLVYILLIRPVIILLKAKSNKERLYWLSALLMILWFIFGLWVLCYIANQFDSFFGWIIGMMVYLGVMGLIYLMSNAKEFENK